MSPASRVLVVGRGGREHALMWRLARDEDVSEVLAAPGNDGIGRRFRRLMISEDDAASLAEACRAERIDLVVIGPEAPLVAGLADRLRDAGVLVYGPGAQVAQLESSKWFAKEIMAEAKVPSARAEPFEEPVRASRALDGFGPPWVIKADGLAAGKGVRVTRDRREAEAFIRACLVEGRFAAGGRRILLEEFLAGEELSAMAVCDGHQFTLLPTARDYKRAFDGDQGPNTGGMGAHAPAEMGGPDLEAEVGRRVIAPVLEAMARRGMPFRGTLYAGLMMGERGLQVIEFNCRFGDPETQVVLPLLKGSLASLLTSAARGTLRPGEIRRAPGSAVAVAVVDEGYPDAVRGEGSVEGLEALMEERDLEVFHAAAAWDAGRWRVSGGRVAYVMARAATRAAARERVYAALARLGGTGWRCRHDIAVAPAETMGGADGR